MAYVIFKENIMLGKHMTILVNDSEGIPMEFDTYDAAHEVATLFESNSHHGSKYSVKQIN